MVQIGKNQTRAPNLEKLLTDPNVTKIFHYARFDVAVLKNRFGIEVSSRSTAPRSPRAWCSTYTDRHGLKDLARELLNVDLSKQQQSSDWGAEKLIDAQLDYAASDVLYLHDLKRHLDRMLEREGSPRTGAEVLRVPADPRRTRSAWAGRRSTSSPIARRMAGDDLADPAVRAAVFMRLTRRNRVIDVLRIVVPLIGALLLGVLIAGIVIGNLAREYGVSGVRFERDRLLIETPRYEGVTENGTRYRVVAETASALISRADLSTSARPRLEIIRPDGVCFTATADMRSTTVEPDGRDSRGSPTSSTSRRHRDPASQFVR